MNAGLCRFCANLRSGILRRLFVDSRSAVVRLFGLVHDSTLSRCNDLKPLTRPQSAWVSEPVQLSINGHFERLCDALFKRQIVAHAQLFQF